jgi:hypothetical protein
MLKQSYAAIILMASLSAQGVVYDNGTWVTNPVTNVSELQTAAPFSFFTLGFNVNNAAPVRPTEEFTVTSGLAVTDIEVFFYNTNAVAPSCTGVFLSLFNSDPATTTPTQLIPGAGSAVNLIGAPGFTVANTMTGTYRVTTATLTSTARQIQSVKVTLPATIALTPGTYYLQWSLLGSITPPTAAIPFYPPITTLNVFNTGNGRQEQPGPVYVALNQNIGPAPGTPIPGATQGAPFRLYGTGGLTGAITNLAGGCSTATFAVKGAPTIGGHLRADLTNVNPLTLGAVILGASSPGVPLPCGCTLLASTDVLNPSGFVELQVPVNSSLIGTTLFTQGVELDLVGIASLPCQIGIGVALTDAFSFQLNIN